LCAFPLFLFTKPAKFCVFSLFLKKLEKRIKKVLTNGIESGIIFGHPQKGAGPTGPELKKKRVSSEL
jgi:hypothetical protein